MEIKRKFEVLVATHRRYVIEHSPVGRQMMCLVCREPMLTTEQAAGLFAVKQRRIFQIIEAAEAHFAEDEADVVMICLSSLAAVFDRESQEGKRMTTTEKRVK